MNVSLEKHDDIYVVMHKHAHGVSSYVVRFSGDLYAEDIVNHVLDEPLDPSDELDWCLIPHIVELEAFRHD